jgi:hypothetical protein
LTQVYKEKQGQNTIRLNKNKRLILALRGVLVVVPRSSRLIPVDLDYWTEMILRKAHVLADDWRIESPDLIRQLMPE